METAKEKGGGGQGLTPRCHEHQEGRNKTTVDTEGRNKQPWHWDLMDGGDQGSMDWEWRSTEAMRAVSGGRSVCCPLELARGLPAPPGRTTGRGLGPARGWGGW